MKKLLFALLLATMLTACTSKIYNSSLKQIELGMTKEQVVSLMGNEYTVVGQDYNNQTIKYVDRFKNHWFFEFVDGRLYKWFKETEQ